VGRVCSSIDERLAQFLQAQHLFFVASAPLAAEGHVNVSPKGLDTFRILSPTRVAYLDLTGSGIETVAHVKENGRIVLMFCALQGSPTIVRLHGKGRVIECGDSEFASVSSLFPKYEGRRCFVVVDVTRVSQSCGFAVPLLRFEADRPTLGEWTRKKGEDSLKQYRETKNRTSIDGLSGLADPSSNQS
jgi:hypothetical protein